MTTSHASGPVPVTNHLSVKVVKSHSRRQTHSADIGWFVRSI